MNRIIPFLALCVCTAAAGLIKAPSELEEVALGHYISLIAQNREQKSQTLYFAQTDLMTETTLHKKYPYRWFLLESEFVSSRDGYHRLRTNDKIKGVSISASYFEATADGWRCILTVHAGPLGEESVRCYFVLRDKKWIVKEFVSDPSLPIS